jgi:hypothetical protein
MRDCCIFRDINEISSLFEELAEIPQARIVQMQADCIAMYANIRNRLTYSPAQKTSHQYHWNEK